MKVIYRDCLSCGATFIVPSPNRRYCDNCCASVTGIRPNPKRPPIYRDCRKCSTNFAIPSANRRFCNDCMVVKNTKPIACKTCATDFKPKGNQRHCSVCKPNREKVWVQCAKCSGPLDTSHKKYCSDCDRTHPKHKLQDGNCEICGKFGQLNRDHDHFCCQQRTVWERCGKCERGFLCNTCNMFLGRINDSIEALENGIEYLIRNMVK